MEKQANKSEHQLHRTIAGNDRVSRVLLVAAVVLYSLALVLLANLALATSSRFTSGALIKVNHHWASSAASTPNISIRSSFGNILTVDVQSADEALLQQTNGICHVQMDHKTLTESIDRNEALRNKFAYTGVVIGVLDNTGNISLKDREGLLKVDEAANIGFASYRSEEPGSPVIMRNLYTGESNLLQALAYMQTYARTVNLPLVVELLLTDDTQRNPLFVQVCQSMAEDGIQFIGNLRQPETPLWNAPMQFAFGLIDAATGTTAQRSDFWTLNEMNSQPLSLTGTDSGVCRMEVDGDNGFDKVFVRNASNNEVMVTVLTPLGDVHYYRITAKETALIPRTLLNGSPVLEDGSASIFPFHSKQALFNHGPSNNQFMHLCATNSTMSVEGTRGFTMNMAAPMPRTLAMTLKDLKGPVSIEIRDSNGKMVYKNRPNEETKSITARIDLSEGEDGLYFLDMHSNEDHRSLALLLD